MTSAAYGSVKPAARSSVTFAAVAFAAGVAWLQQQAELPPLGWAWLIAPLALLAARWHRSFFLLAFALGFFWAAAAAHQRMADWLAPGLEGRDLEVIGVVSGLPAVSERGARFELEIESAPEKLPGKVLVSWYRSQSPEEGS